jgi:hypothetical protein
LRDLAVRFLSSQKSALTADRDHLTGFLCEGLHRRMRRPAYRDITKHNRKHFPAGLLRELNFAGAGADRRLTTFGRYHFS